MINTSVKSFLEEALSLSSNFSAYGNECIDMWWIPLQAFKARTWQVWAIPRKQIITITVVPVKE